MNLPPSETNEVYLHSIFSQKQVTINILQMRRKNSKCNYYVDIKAQCSIFHFIIVSKQKKTYYVVFVISLSQKYAIFHKVHLSIMTGADAQLFLFCSHLAIKPFQQYFSSVMAANHPNKVL